VRSYVVIFSTPPLPPASPVRSYVVIFATVPLMAFKLERYQTSSSRERAIHLKLFCFQARDETKPSTLTQARSRSRSSSAFRRAAHTTADPDPIP
jgi:hypothetical protein